MLAEKLVDDVTHVERRSFAGAMVGLTDQIDFISTLVDTLSSRAECSKEVRAIAVALDMHNDRLRQLCDTMVKLSTSRNTR